MSRCDEQIRVRIDEQVHTLAKARAADLDVTLAEYLRWLIVSDLRLSVNELIALKRGRP